MPGRLLCQFPQPLRKRLTGESLPPSCSVGTGPRSRCARLHPAARDPLESPIITAISSGTSPSACYRRGFHSSACIPWFIPHSLMVPLHAEGINQYATPNINRADREFESVPPTFPVGLSMKRLRQKASLRGGRCQLRQQMTEGVPYISRSAP